MKNTLLNRKRVNPGIPVFTGVKQTNKTHIQLFSYNEETFIENNNFAISNFNGFQEDKFKSWLNTHGIHNSSLIHEICDKLEIHDLVTQDILDVNQRPKFQEYDNHWFFTLKSIIPSDNSSIELEQLSFILGNNYLVSFQERKADYFNHIRERIRNNIGIVRERGCDYLLFLLLESILDNYFKELNKIEEKIENQLLSDIQNNPSPLLLKSIERYKNHLYRIKRAILPIKEFTIKLEREKFSFIDKKNVKYFFELKDLCLSLIDECEQIELQLESNTNLFFSIQSHRMNQVMKTLTVVSTIFIPLTFIVGIYGMNFPNMPELNWKWGYLGIWIIMITIFIGMALFFRRKKWL